MQEKLRFHLLFIQFAPLFADFITVYLVNQNLRQRCNDLKWYLKTRIVVMRIESWQETAHLVLIDLPHPIAVPPTVYRTGVGHVGQTVA